MAALLEEVVTILGPIRRDSYEGQTGHKVGTRAAQTKVLRRFSKKLQRRPPIKNKC